ncbi:helix-turn-helix domain-containing protein [Roseovarius salis]|uniref:Crp/Fnr family transcriptional regulator n=1 Tax=Roseovarius salis TaxID=3376063 RepID=UPI0037CB4ACF
MFSELNPTKDPDALARVFPTGDAGGLPSRVQAAFPRHVQSFRDNSTLLLEDEECRSVFYLIDGWLALSKSLTEGQTQIIDFALPGEIVDPVSGDGVTSNVTVEALSDGAVIAVPYAGWERMTDDWRDLNHALHRIESAQTARRSERMLRLGKASAETRVAYALLEFCVRIDAACDRSSPAFHVPLTQQQLGDYVGLSSVHVCRTMRRMSRNGIIVMTNHMDIRVLDPQAMAALAGIDRENLRRRILPGSCGMHAGA